jgi:hypothetical protein
MGKNGRPKCLDEDSLEKCVDFFRQQSDKDLKKLRAEIRQAAKETVDRHNRFASEAGCKKISIRSVKRYEKHIVKTVHEENMDS